MFRKFFTEYRLLSDKDRQLKASIRNITGKKPNNLDIYRQAIRHRSIAPQNEKGVRESNERLEYLGDALLSAIVAEYLFKKFPLKEEGFLTEIRSRIVNRDKLNLVARKIGIENVVEYSNNKKNHLAYKSIFGDTLEAIIGAVYVDHGFKTCRKFIIKKLIQPHYDLEEVLKINPNYKSKIIEWAHRQNKDIEFRITEIRGGNHNKEFIAELYIENEPISRGTGFSKKKAEQNAAEKSCELLEIK
ncbi:MAG: ribonuclease III [Cyclobacteriaceae bacterium]|nr:ribonuclease III [Cyclobacteriaceae bacterium]